MAKHLLLSIIEDVLGDFIFGLTKENLKVGVFSGRLEFHNLVLKTGPLGGALRDLMLPIAITTGFIKHIDISIPWASLGKNPVRVVVEDLLLQLRPLDPTTEHPSATEAEAAAVKRNKALLVEEMKELVESLIFSSEQQNPAVKALIRLLLANKRFSSISSILRATPTQSSVSSVTSFKSQSYLQRLVTKILDNLEVSVKNVHIRYEDAVSLPRHVISAGITLSELTLSSADENWQPRKAKSSSQATSGIFSMRKLFDLEDLSVYCHTIESLSFSNISPFSAWCDCMVAVIYSSQRQPDLEYILVPPNAVQIRFNHREIASESDPKVSIGFIGQLTLALSKNQLSHIATAVNTLMEVVLQKGVNIMRPKVRPTADKKIWWRYIFMLVRKNYERSMTQTMKLCIQHRANYMSLFRRDLVSEGNLSSRETEEIEQLEALLPVCAIGVYQRIVAENCLKELVASKDGKLETEGTKKKKSVLSKIKKVFGIKREKDIIAEALTASSQGDTTVGGGSKVPLTPTKPRLTEEFLRDIQPQSQRNSGSFPDDMSDDIAIDQLEIALEKELETFSIDVSNEEHVLFRVELSLLINLIVSTGPKLPILTAHANFNASLEMKPSGFFATFNAMDLYIRDTSLVDNVLPYIVSFSESEGLAFPLSPSTKQSKFTITFDNTIRTGATLRVVALPMKVVVNPHIIRKVADVFTCPINRLIHVSDVAKSLSTPHQRSKTHSATSNRFEYFAIENISFLIDVEAPKIIFPEDASKASGAFLVVDTGHLIISGHLTQMKGLHFDLTLTKLTTGLPITLKNCLEAIYSKQTEDVSLLPNTIMFPFDIKLVLENETESLPADVVGEFELKQELKIEVTPANFARLMHIVETIVSVTENIILAVEKDQKESRFFQSTRKRRHHSSHSFSRICRYSDDNFLADLSSFVTTITSRPLRKQKDKINRHMFFVRATMPRLVLLMRFDAFHNHLSVGLDNLSTDIIARPWDLKVDVSFSRLMIQDSSRIVSQREVLWNNIADSAEDSNVNVEIVKVFDKQRSSLFDGVATSVSIGMRYLMIKIDSNTILHLRPFLDSFLAYTVNKANRSLDSSDTKLTLQQVHFISKDTNASRTIVGVDLGTRVKFDIQKISIETFRISNIDEWKPKIGRYGRLESVYCLSLETSQVSMKIQNGLLSVSVSARNCFIDDTRPISTEFYYRKMVTTTYDRSSWVAKIDKVSVNPKDSHFVRTQIDSQVHECDFFVVRYEELAKNKSKIDIDVSKAAVFFSADNLLDSLHVSLQISFAIMKLVQIIDERELFVSEAFDSSRHLSPTEDHHVDNDGQIKPSAATKVSSDDEDDETEAYSPELVKKAKKLTRPDDNVNLVVQILDPLLFILEDPSLDCTRAFLVSTNVVLKKNITTHQDGNQEARELMDTIVQNVEVFSVKSMIDVNIQRIVHPFGLSVQILQNLLIPSPSIRNILSASIHLAVESMEVELDIDDLFLAYSSGMRYLIAREWSASKAPPNSIYDSSLILVGEAPKKVEDVGTLIGVYILNVLIDDSKFVLSTETPLLLVHMNNTSFAADGALQPILYFDSASLGFNLVSHHVEGGGSTSISVDFFNSNICLWEPLVETFQTIINVSRGQQGITITNLVKELLQLNISGVNVKAVLELLEYIKQSSERSQYDRIGRLGTKKYGGALAASSILGGVIDPVLSKRTLRKIAKNAIKLTNNLPIAFKYAMKNDEGSEEVGEVQPGDTAILDAMDLTKNPKLSFQIGTCQWTRPRRVRVNEAWTNTTELTYSSSPGGVLTLSLTSMPVVIDDKVTIEYSVYSTAILLDRSRLGLSIKTRFNFKDMIRHSVDLGSRNAPIDRGIVYGLPGDASPVITKFKVTSRRSYKISTASLGGHVYTDSEFRWTHLKPFLGGENQFIKTADDDRKTMMKELMSFSLTKKPAFVIIFVDSRAKALPLWMVEEGYSRAFFAEPVVAECTEKGMISSKNVERRFYQAWGKYFNVDDPVIIGGNCAAANSSVGMFLVSVLDPFSPLISQELSVEIAEQIGYNYDYSEDCWSHGGDGVCLFHSADGSYCIGEGSDKSWSTTLHLDGFNNLKEPFEFTNKTTGRTYLLAALCAPLPGIFYRTKLVTVMPRFLIVNRMNQKIFLRQYELRGNYVNTGEDVSINAFDAVPWHMVDSSLGTLLQLRTEMTCWSFRGFDINEIGVYDLLLPSDNSSSTNRGFSSSSISATVVANIDVRISSPKDMCSVIVFISAAAINDETSHTSISIKNESDEIITVVQANVNFGSNSVRDQYIVTIPPNVWTPFGWADTFIDSKITVYVGLPPEDLGEAVATTVGILHLHSPCRLAYPVRLMDESGHVKYSISAELEMEVFAIGSGRVLRIYRVANELMTDSRLSLVTAGGMQEATPVLSQTATGAIVTGAVLGTLILGPVGGFAVGGAIAGASLAVGQDQTEETEEFSLPDSGRIKSSIFGTPFVSEDVVINFEIDQLGVSLIVERPKRREFLSLHLMHIRGMIKVSNQLLCVDVSVQDLQLDNYSESALYPVLLHSTERAPEKGNQHPPPALQLIVVRDDSFPSRSRTAHFRYIAVRVMELELAVDSATIQLLLSDLTEDLGVVTADQKLCLEDPQRWMHNYSRLVMSPGHRLHFFSRLPYMSSNNIYIEQLFLHPIHINITYTHSEFPRAQEDNVLMILSYIPSFAAVDRFQIKLSSFTVEEVLESETSLISRILKKTLYDLQLHLAGLAGNLAVLGRPMGLVKNIGGGVQSLFYEPWEGLMKSPGSFVIGLGKGASGFVNGVFVGTLESTSSLVGSYSAGISSGLTAISLDKKLLRRRNKIRKAGIDAARKGFLSSMWDAGSNIVLGVAGGVSGLVCRPIEEAKTGGAIGFVRGVGIGVIGVAVQPILGVADGISSTMHGINYNVGNYRTPEIIRPPRKLQSFDHSSPSKAGSFSDEDEDTPIRSSKVYSSTNTIIIPLAKEFGMDFDLSTETRMAIIDSDLDVFDDIKSSLSSLKDSGEETSR